MTSSVGRAKLLTSQEERRQEGSRERKDKERGGERVGRCYVVLPGRHEKKKKLVTELDPHQQS